MTRTAIDQIHLAVTSELVRATDDRRPSEPSELMSIAACDRRLSALQAERLQLVAGYYNSKTYTVVGRLAYLDDAPVAVDGDGHVYSM